jgi:hypothetical protein
MIGRRIGRSHGGLGLLLVLPLLFTAGTGFLLNHPGWLGEPGDPELCLAPHPVDPDVVYAGRASGLWRSDDGGATWSEPRMLAPPTVVVGVAFAPDDPSRILAAGAAGDLIFSRDGGGVWETLPRPELDGRVEGLDVGPDGIVWLRTTAGLLRSDDGARTWRTVAAAPAPTLYERLHGLHSGWAFGPRWRKGHAVSVVGLVLLAVSGLVLWWRRRD